LIEYILKAHNNPNDKKNVFEILDYFFSFWKIENIKKLTFKNFKTANIRKTFRYKFEVYQNYNKHI
jgi:hypothetical protein